jgi:Arc/MetJ family transcription regulator
MRTNIDIDDKLMEQALRLSGLKTKRAVIEAALQMFVQVKHQSDISKLAGKVEFWDDVDDRAERAAE